MHPEVPAEEPTKRKPRNRQRRSVHAALVGATDLE
jgi:hypothetical protein